jgi:hypothetical protein
MELVESNAIIKWTEDRDAKQYGATMWLVKSGDEKCCGGYVINEKR